MWRESGGFLFGLRRRRRRGGEAEEWEELRELLADFIEYAESTR